MRPAKISDDELRRHLTEGHGVREISRRTGITAGGISKRVSKLRRLSDVLSAMWRPVPRAKEEVKTFFQIEKQKAQTVENPPPVTPAPEVAQAKEQTPAPPPLLICQRDCWFSEKGILFIRGSVYPFDGVPTILSQHFREMTNEEMDRYEQRRRQPGQASYLESVPADPPGDDWEARFRIIG